MVDTCAPIVYCGFEAPGVVQHVITRFVDRSWQLVGDDERAAYLERLASHRFAGSCQMVAAHNQGNATAIDSGTSYTAVGSARV